MANILRITSRKSNLINYNPDMIFISGLGLFADYQDTQYYLCCISGGISLEKDLKDSVTLHFSRRDGKDIPHGLNVILLMTDCKGSYKATGLSKFDNLEWYRLGDDLEIYIDSSVDKAVRSIPKTIPSLFVKDVTYM